jgi:predicted GIY-YIG superfamily endonuclease
VYVYLIKSTETGYYKIGYSRNPTQRLKQLQTGCPDELQIIETFRSNHARKIEGALHNSYNYACKHNEWFELAIEDEVKFKKLCETIENNLILIENLNF